MPVEDKPMRPALPAVSRRHALATIGTGVLARATAGQRQAHG